MKKILRVFRSLTEYISQKKMLAKYQKVNYDANMNIRICNDPNDPLNKIYVFVYGVPVALVSDVEIEGENCVLIDQVGKYLSNIKKMYRNRLNGHKII